MKRASPPCHIFYLAVTFELGSHYPLSSRSLSIEVHLQPANTGMSTELEIGKPVLGVPETLRSAANQQGFE